MHFIKYAAVVALPLFTGVLYAQTSINSGGNSLKNNAIAVDYAVGQIAIATLGNQNTVATQGLLQPDPLIDCSLVQVTARPDSFIMPLADGQFTFDPLLNDNLPFAIKISAVENPVVGQLTPGAPGSPWIYRIDEPDFSGIVNIRYTICPLLCPDACDSSTISIRVVSGIPNVITPNADGFNDTFDPLQTLRELGISALPKNFQILNRSGEVIWASEAYEPWDARVRKTYVTEGAYFYLLMLEDGQVFKGPISVVTH